MTLSPSTLGEGPAGRRTTTAAHRPVPRLGAHVAVRDGLVAAAGRARALGAGAIQVFVDDPRAWEPRATPHPDADRFRQLLAEQDVVLLVHASYLVNLASPDAEVRGRGIGRVTRELVAAARLGARAVTVHVGSHRGAGVDVGTDRVADGIARIMEGADREAPGHGRDAPRLLLETSAGQGDAMGVTLPQMAAILEAAARRGVGRRRLGVCLDTAHLWGSGHALDDPATVDGLLRQADALPGPEALALVHLNDSHAARGSRQDRHAHIGAGRIGEAGLGHLVRHPRLADVPMILETPELDAGWDALDMARVRSLASASQAPEPNAPPAAVVRDGMGGGAPTHTPGSPPDPA